MGAFAERLARGEALLHLDWIDYAERLFAGGAADWRSPAAIATLLGKAQALLPSDIVVLPLGRMLAAYTPAMGAEMRSRPGGAAPLRALLADPALRAAVVEAAAITGTMIDDAGLALGAPAPAELAALAATSAGLPAPDGDEDTVDDAAVYLADFLRCLAAVRIDALILAESAARGTAIRDLYAPVGKVAAAYGWAFSVAAPGEPIRPGVNTVHIAPDSEPEAVLADVRRLRQ